MAGMMYDYGLDHRELGEQFLVLTDLYGEGTQQKKVEDRFFMGEAKTTSRGTLKYSFP